MEIETNNSIAYLDTKLYRKNNKIIFNWYKKDIASGRMINFNSTQPKSQIINTAKNFIARVIKTSDEQFHKENIVHIKNTLTNNNFPTKLTNTLIDEMIRKLKNKNDINENLNNNKEQKLFFSVPYIPGLTDNKNIRNAIENKNINFAYKANTTLNTIFTKTKTIINKQQQNNVVYEIQCKGNENNKCDKIYIGTTKRNLETRIKEHKNDIEKHKHSTALAQHIFENNHTADFDNIRILDKEKTERKRYTLESLRIQQKREKTMNMKEDTDKISASYRVAIG